MSEQKQPETSKEQELESKEPPKEQEPKTEAKVEESAIKNEEAKEESAIKKEDGEATEKTEKTEEDKPAEEKKEGTGTEDNEESDEDSEEDDSEEDSDATGKSKKSKNSQDPEEEKQEPQEEKLKTEKSVISETENQLYQQLPGPVTLYDKIQDQKIQTAMEKGRLHVENKEWDLAIATYKKILFLKPNVPFFLEQQADNYSQKEYYELAILHYKKAYRLSANKKIVLKLNKMLFSKGLEMIQQGSYDEVLELFNEDMNLIEKIKTGDTTELTKDSEKAAIIHYIRALAYMNGNLQKEALKELEESLGCDEYFTDAYILKGKIFWTMGKKKEGNMEFWKAEAIDPNHPEVKEFIKIINPEIAEFQKQTNEAIIKNDLTRAFILVNKGLQCQPGHSFMLIKRAFIQRKWMNFNSALKDLELASQQMKQYSLKNEIKHQISLTYNEMGQYLFQGGQYDQALQLFSEALNFNLEDPGVLINQGDCFRKLGDSKRALKNYLYALEKEGKVTPVIGHRLGYAYHCQGVICYNNKNFIEAIEEFTRAIEYYPIEACFYVDRATCYVTTGAMKKAEKDYYEAHQIDPKNAEALNYVGKFDDSSSKPYRNVIVLNNDD